MVELTEIETLIGIRTKMTTGDNKKFVKVSAAVMKSLEKYINDGLAAHLKVKK